MPLPDNEQVNVEFVVAVEDHPVLYNHNLKEYSNRHEQDKAWRILADQFGSTDMECKLRWRNLRNSFLRYMRTKNSSGNAARKPYYLWDHLQYIMPYIKPRTQAANYDMVPQQLANNLEEEEDSNLQDNLHGETLVAGDEQYLASDEVTILASLSSSPSSCRNAKAHVKTVNPLEKAITTYFEKKGAQPKDPTANADLCFLTSLLPDMASLPPRKKRTFKRKVLQLLDELSEDELSESSRDTTSTTQATSPTLYNRYQNFK